MKLIFEKWGKNVWIADLFFDEILVHTVFQGNKKVMLEEIDFSNSAKVIRKHIDSIPGMPC